MPTRNEASAVSELLGPRTPTIPASVSRAEVSEAIKPLCDLLGISVWDFFDSPGITVGNGVVTFTLATQPHDKGTAPVVSQAQIGGVVIVGERPHTHETGLEVTVAVRNHG